MALILFFKMKHYHSVFESNGEKDNAVRVMYNTSNKEKLN